MLFKVRLVIFETLTLSALRYNTPLILYEIDALYQLSEIFNDRTLSVSSYAPVCMGLDGGRLGAGR